MALGEIESIGLLRHADPLVVISPWVAHRELRKFHDQVRLGVEEGWLRVLEPSDTEVRNLIRAASSLELDRGEAETLVIAGYQGSRPTTVLIDEGEAHVFARNVLIRAQMRAARNNPAARDNEPLTSTAVALKAVYSTECPRGNVPGLMPAILVFQQIRRS